MSGYHFPAYVVRDREGWAAHCPDFPDCRARGMTYEEALNNLRDVIQILVLDVRRGEEVRFTSPSRICAALQMGSTVVSELFDSSRLGALYRYTEACTFEAVEERCAALARAPDVVDRGLAARERFRAETSMADNLGRAMDLPIFRELAAGPAL